MNIKEIDWIFEKGIKCSLKELNTTESNKMN